MTENPMPQSPALPTWATVFRVAIRIGPRIAITTGTICYGLGLLIVSSRLAELGVHTTEFFKTEYVLAGAEFCILSILAAIAVHYIFAAVQDARERWKEKKYLLASFLFAVTLGSSLYVFTQFLGLVSTNNLGSYTNWRTWVALAIAVFPYIVFRSTAEDLHGFRDATLERERKGAPIQHAWLLGMDFIAIISAIGLYTSYVYPNLLPQYGGGYRDPVLLIPTDIGKRVARIAGLPFKSNGSIGPVQLLLENQQDLTVTAIKHGHAVSIASDLIEAVVEYKPPKTGTKPAQSKRVATRSHAGPKAH